jgi:hypothetical protein
MVFLCSSAMRPVILRANADCHAEISGAWVSHHTTAHYAISSGMPKRSNVVLSTLSTTIWLKILSTCTRRRRCKRGALSRSRRQLLLRLPGAWSRNPVRGHGLEVRLCRTCEHNIYEDCSCSDGICGIFLRPIPTLADLLISAGNPMPVAILIPMAM